MTCMKTLSLYSATTMMTSFSLQLKQTHGIIPFSDCGEYAASLVSVVVSFMVEGRVGSVKG